MGPEIQKALDTLNERGGGTLILQEGTYHVHTPLTITTPINLRGANFATTVIDFDDTDNNITATGSDIYTTGTVAVNDASTSVTGTGTTWTSAMIGRQILLLGNWYPIVAVGGTTSLTLAFAYSGNNLSGSTYAIANPLDGVDIKDLTVQNSASSNGAVYVKYALRTLLNDYVIQDSTIGIELEGIQNFNIVAGNCLGNGTNFKINNVGSATLNNFLSINSTSHGVEVSNTANFEISNFSIINSGGDGIHLSDCSNMGIIDFSIDANTGQGIELASNCTGIQIIVGTITNGGSDGVKLTATSDRCSIGPLIFENNTGYGINIAAATCDDNTIIVPTFINNTSGDYNDSGTGTNIVATVQTSPRYTAGEEITGATLPVPVFYNATEIANNDTHLTIAATGATKDFGYDDSSSYRWAQEFQSGTGWQVDRVKIRLRKQGSPTDNVRVSIQAAVSNAPSGTILASATVAGSGLTGTYAQTTFVLDFAITLSNTTQYWVVIERTGALDAVNYYEAEGANSSTYANGRLKRDTDPVSGPSWIEEISEELDLVIQDLSVIYEADKVYTSDANDTDRDVFLGLATTTADADELVTVEVIGVVDGFSGLTVNSTYYVQNTIGTIGTAAGTTSLPVGLAIATDKILIDRT